MGKCTNVVLSVRWWKERMSNGEIESGKTYIRDISAREEDLGFRSIDVAQDDIAVGIDSRIHAIVTYNEQAKVGRV
jgi:hypothetical protein